MLCSLWAVSYSVDGIVDWCAQPRWCISFALLLTLASRGTQHHHSYMQNQKPCACGFHASCPCSMLLSTGSIPSHPSPCPLLVYRCEMGLPVSVLVLYYPIMADLVQFCNGRGAAAGREPGSDAASRENLNAAVDTRYVLDESYQTSLRSKSLLKVPSATSM